MFFFQQHEQQRSDCFCASSGKVKVDLPATRVPRINSRHNITMGIFDNIRNSAVKTKLQTEISLLERQIIQKKSALGVELYDKMTAQQNSNKVPGINVAIPVPASLFPQNSDIIRDQLDDCRRDLQPKINEMNACSIELEKLAATRERANPNQGTFTKAGAWMSNTGKDAELRVRIKFLEREIYQRKEKFGVDVYDIVVENVQDTSSNKRSGNVIASGIGKIGQLTGVTNKAEKEIHDCIQMAVRQVTVLRQQIESKHREIVAVNEGVR